MNYLHIHNKSPRANSYKSIAMLAAHSLRKPLVPFHTHPLLFFFFFISWRYKQWGLSFLFFFGLTENWD